MERPPIVGDLVTQTNPNRFSEIYRVTAVNTNDVTYVLVSEVTPVKHIRKFYKTSKLVFTCSHADFARFSLNIRGILDDELLRLNKLWSPIIDEIKS